MITQCSIRHLYNASPKNDAHIDTAKTFERRRCGHHLLEQPLSTLECLSSVVDPKSSSVNKFNYVVASQDDNVRAKMRSIPGVPLIYIKRSIMVLEPMAGASSDVRTREERTKFKSGVVRTNGRGSGVLGKRRREEDEGEKEEERGGTGVGVGRDELERKRRNKGPKGPNPLSMKKPKVRETREVEQEGTSPKGTRSTVQTPTVPPSAQASGLAGVNVVKKKRKRKHKSNAQDSAAATVANTGDVPAG